MAINGSVDLTHIIRTTKQWEDTFDKSEIIPSGVLCVEFTPKKSTLIKIGDGHHRYADLPYVTGNSIDLSDYYTKEEVDAKFPDDIVTIKGLTNNNSNIPKTGKNGDLWFVENTDKDGNKVYDHYIWYNGEWRYCKSTSGEIDIREYVEQIVNEFISALRKAGELHIHRNKEILDNTTASYTKEEKEKLETLENYDDTEIRDLIKNIITHSHDNKEILDRITAAFTTEYENKLNSLENYDDTAVVEDIEGLQKLAHSHDNKDILDQTTASFTTEYEYLMRWIRKYTGATMNDDGIMGLVPPAERGQEDYFLNGAGEWVPGGSGISDIISGPGIEIGVDDETFDEESNIYEISLKPSTEFEIGGVIPGEGLSVDEDGILNIKYDAATLSINENDELTAISKTYYEGNGIVFELMDTFSIPDGYQEVEYIESDGAVFNTQYVNTVNTRIVADMLARDNGNTWQALFGSRYYSVENFRLVNFHVMCKANSTSSYGMDGETYIDLIWQNTRILIDFSKDALLISQVETGLTRDPIAINSNGINGRSPIYIFAMNDGDSAAARSSARLYSMKIYENDILVRYFVPVQNLSNGTYGIFDVVTQTYIPPFQNSISIYGKPTSSFADVKETINVNIGEGLSFDDEGKLNVDFPDPYELPAATENTLGGIIVGDGLNISPNGVLSVAEGDKGDDSSVNIIAGDNIQIEEVESSEKYQVVEYIQSDGYERIKTDIYLNASPHIFNLKYQFDEWNNTFQTIYCVGSTSENGSQIYGMFTNSITAALVDSNGAEWHSMSKRISLNTTYVDTVEESETRHGSSIVGMLNHSYPFKSNGRVHIMGNQYNAPYEGEIDPSKTVITKLWYMRITDGDKLAADLIPVIRMSDNEVGLYDKVSDKFYTNTYSNYPFIAGNPTGEIIYSKNAVKISAIVPDPYELPIASDETLGGIKVGDGLSINENGVLSLKESIREYVGGIATDVHEIIQDDEELYAVDVNYGDGLTVNDDNKLEVQIGDGLRFDENGVIVMDSSVNVNIKAGLGIDIVKDEETQESIINIKYSDGLTVDKNGVLSVNNIHAYQVDMTDYQPGDKYTPIEGSDNVLTAIGKLDIGLIAKENKIPRFTKAEYEQALLDGTAPNPGELFIITDDDSSDFKCVQDVIVTRNEVGKLDIVRNGETKTIDIFDQLDILFLNCIEDN